MLLKEFLEKQLKEKVVEVKHSESGWHQVIRADQPESTRYYVKLDKKLTGYDVVCQDHVKGEPTVYNSVDIVDGVNFWVKNTKGFRKTLRNFNNFFNELKPFKDNGYLKSHKLENIDCSHLKVNDWAEICVPYVPPDNTENIVGIKKYSPKGKFFMKGSTAKGVGAYHQYDKHNTITYLCEGLCDALVVKHLIEGNVIEVGSTNNMESIINQIKTDIVVCGENDAVAFYQGLKSKHPRIKLIFPKICKDISDYYVEAGEEATMEILAYPEENINSYQPLGFLGKNLVLYSKTLLTVQDFSLSNMDEILKLGCGFQNTGLLKKNEKESIIDKLIEENSKIGQYKAHNERGAGLWEYRGRHFYNTGKNVYRVNKDQITKLTFTDIVRDDFLLNSRPCTLSALNDQTFNIKELHEILKACDWEHPFYGSVLLGFIIQSVYSGSIEFRPHLWIKSDLPRSGKSWLTSWIAQNLVPSAPTAEGSGTTVKGFRQSLRFWSGMAFIDEFGESDAYDMNSVKAILQTMRSGSTATNPITLGTKQQVPIEITVKFSALLSCIKGYSYVAPQDFERIIFLKLKRDGNSNFVGNTQDRFIQFAKDNSPEGFLRFCLMNFYRYDTSYKYWVDRLNKESKDLGHKVRGFASVLAGFYCAMRDKDEVEKLYTEIMDSSISDTLEIEDMKNDLYEDLCKTIISRNATGLSSDMPFYEAVNSGFLTRYGIEIKNDQLVIVPKLASSFVEKYFKGVVPSVFFQQLKKCEDFIEYGFTRPKVMCKTARCIKLNWNFKEEKEDDTDI